MVKICFRLDDPSPSSDKDIEAKIIDVFARNELPLSVAVVPFSKGVDGEKITRNKSKHILDGYENNLLEISLHGYSHIKRGKNASGLHGEFVGIGLDEQRRLMEEGCEVLSEFIGGKIEGFVPPYNIYDKHTLEAANELGFNYVSAGTSVLIRDSRISVIPATCNLKNAEKILETAVKLKGQSSVVIIYFHPDDFKEYKWPPLPGEPAPFTTLGNLNRFLSWIASTDDIEVKFLNDIAHQIDGCCELVYLSEINWIKRLPWPIQKNIPKGILLKPKASELLKIVIHAIFTSR